jgi:hypothetical protein
MAPPFTLRYLYGVLDGLFGPDKWSVDVDYGNYRLIIATGASASGSVPELMATLTIIKPAQ